MNAAFLLHLCIHQLYNIIIQYHQPYYSELMIRVKKPKINCKAKGAGL